MAANTTCPVAVDNSFGPGVGFDSPCRDGFDFTLLFEQSILTLLPAALFLLAFLMRITYLYRAREERKTGDNKVLPTLKVAGAVVFVALQATILVLFRRAPTTAASISATAINLAVAIEFLALSWVEGIRTARPSSVLAAYLIFTIVLDTAQARTLWLLQDTVTPLAACFSASLGVKVLLLLLELQPKPLGSKYSNLPPEATNSIISRGLMLWINKLFRRAFRRLVSVGDLYELDAGLASGPAGEKLERAWETRRRPERRHEFVWALCRAFWWPMVKVVPPKLLSIGLVFSQPLLIKSILDLVSNSDANDTLATRKGYALIGAAFFIYFGIDIVSVFTSDLVSRCVTMARGGMVSLIYNRLLGTPDGDDNSLTVTLMSTDTNVIVSSFHDIHDLWALSIQVTLGLYLLAREIGWVCVVPLVVVVVSSYLSSLVAKRIGGNQKQWVAAVQKRVGATASVLAEMRSIKMMGLGPLMTDRIQRLRVEETDMMKKFRWDTVSQNVIANLPPAIAAPLTFVVYAIQASATGNTSYLDTTKAFTSLSIITLLTGPVMRLLQTVPMTAASVGSYDRVQTFLTSPLRQDERQPLRHRFPLANLAATSPAVGSESDRKRAAVTSNRPASAKSSRAEEQILIMENLSIRPAPTADVVLRAVNLTAERGSLSVILGAVGTGKSTLLRAILGETTNEGGSLGIFETRMSYCGQTPWLPNTTIRKAIEVHTAADAPPADDAWYSTCVRACALDPDLEQLADGDQTQIGSGSTTLSGGQKHRVALARAVYARAPIMVLDDVVSALDNTTKKTVMDRLFGAKRDGLLRRLGSTVFLATHDTTYVSYADNIIFLAEGAVKFAGSYAEAKTAGIINQVIQQEDAAAKANVAKEGEAPGPKKGSLIPKAKATDREDLTRMTGDMAVYKYYLRSVGWSRAMVCLGFVLLDVFAEHFARFWLKMWVDDGGNRIPLFASIYLLLPLVTSIALCGFMWAFLILIAPASSNTLHYTLLRTVMRAPQSFFSVTDSGTTLNRFSQDMTLIESALANGAAIFALSLARCIASIGVLSTGSLYILATIVPLLVAVYFVQFVYLRTSRQLRLLDLEAKSPLYTHFLETAQGLATIRAFGWQQEMRDEGIRLLDYSQKPFYLMTAIQRWLNLVLGLIISAEAVLVVGLALGLRHMTSPGLLGISLNAILAFNLRIVVSNWVMLETSLGAIARVKNFERDVKPEAKEGENQEPPSPDWPTHGAIEFQDVTASHRPDAVALHNITLTIQPGQKVGLCGRTGAGKSSLVAAVLRLLELDSGTLRIDGVDVATLRRDALRGRLVALPQDPLVLAGVDVRGNADPGGAASEAAVRAALERVGLWAAVEARGGLAAEVSGATWSRGQLQLLALARALLLVRAGRRVVLLDEPTSGVDAEADATVQRVLREECSGATVLTVAHRIETIMGSDVVVVLDEGRVVEVGPPGELVRRRGPFAALARAS